MATRSSNRPGLTEAARQVAEHASSIVRLEIQLAVREIRRKAGRLGLGGGLLAGAAVFAWFGLMTAIAAAIAAIALTLPVWASILIVCGGLFLLAALLGLVGLGLVKKASPPLPERAIEEAKLTTEALKNGRH
jgi:DNA-binding transcriptional LysR family regulator